MKIEHVKRKKERKPPTILRGITCAAILVVLAAFLVHYVGYSVQMDGDAMRPAISNSETLLVNKVWYRIFSPKRFDVVSFHLENGTQSYVKRIVALPGETIQIRDGQIWINGEVSEACNSYIQDAFVPGIASEELKLDNDEYFVMGDQASNSEDSRFSNIGPVKKEQLDGIVWFHYGDMTNMGLVH